MFERLIKLKAQIEINSFVKKVDRYPVQNQEKILRHLITTNKNTKFGKEHDFSLIKDVDDFRESVSLSTYKNYVEFIEESKTKSKILTAEPIIHWILSSGSTGKPKVIPLTKEALDKWSIGTSRQFYAYLLDGKNNIDAVKGKILTCVGQYHLYDINGVPTGYISGVAASKLTNPIVRDRFIPKKEIINIVDVNERNEQYILQSINEDVRILSGISTVTLSFLKSISLSVDYIKKIAKDKKTKEKIEAAIVGDEIDIKKIWPNLMYLSSSGVPLEAYRPVIESFLGNIDMLEMYAASEGHFAFQLSKKERGMAFNLDNYFFEFLEEGNGNKTLLIDELKEGKLYDLVVTNPSGFYRYRMADRIKVVSIDPVRILVEGRTNVLANICGEKITEAQAARAFNSTMKIIGLKFSDYILVIDFELPFRHKWVVELSKRAYSKLKVDETVAQTISETIDSELSKMNASYKLAREEISLHKPEIVIVKPGSFETMRKKNAEDTGSHGHSKLLKIVKYERYIKLIEDDMIICTFFKPFKLV